MSTEISYREIKEHIEKLNSLLKQQIYVPQATVLTLQEREKLYNFLYSYNKFGTEKCNFGDYGFLETQEEVDEFNKKVFENMDEEIRAIIVKCGVDPRKIFYLDERGCDINKKLYNSMSAYGIANIGEYTIEVTYGHPIDRESVEVKSFSEEVQQENLNRYKNGEATFRVSCDLMGQNKSIYYHSEGMHFGGRTSFMNKQISGNFGFDHYFSGRYGMDKTDVEIANYINEIMLFLKSFEEILFDALSENNTYNNVKRRQKK